MSNELIPQNCAQAIVQQVFNSILIALQTRTDIRKQQLLSMMREYLDREVQKYIDTLNSKLDKLV